MARVKIAISRLTIPEKIAKATHIDNHMRGNSNFPNALPMLNAMIQARDDLELAYIEALPGGKIRKANQRLKEAALEMKIRKVAFHVNAVAEGDEAIIISSGFEIRRQASPVGLLSPPGVIKVEEGEFPGEVILDWEPVDGSRTYLIQVNDQNPDDEKEWSFQGVSTRSDFTARNLKSGKKTWFRIAAVNSAGTGPFSGHMQGTPA